MRGLLQNGAGDRDPPGLQGPCKNHHLGGAPEFLTPGGGGDLSTSPWQWAFAPQPKVPACHQVQCSVNGNKVAASSSWFLSA